MYSATIEDYEPAHPSSCWYALYTKHQHENTVAHNLLCKGFETFLPLYATARNWKDRVKLLHLPLFPCYVFLKTNLERRLDIITTPGVHALVSNGGQPASIPAAEIESIRQVVSSSTHVEPYPFPKCGDRVRVTSGPLTGIQGILVRKKTIYRLVLSVEMLGKAAAVEIDAVSIERLNEKPSVVDLLAADKRTAGPPNTRRRARFLTNASYTSSEPRLPGYDAATGKLPFLAD